MATDALDRLYQMARLGEAIVAHVKACGLLVEKRRAGPRRRAAGGRAKLSQNPQAVAARKRRAAGGPGAKPAAAPKPATAKPATAKPGLGSVDEF